MCIISVTFALHFINTPDRGQAMSAKRTATMNLRIDPALKEAMKEVARMDYRSMANSIEVMIRDRCDALGIEIKEQTEQSAQVSLQTT